MCITLEPAHMSDTIVSCVETYHPTTGKLIHVAGYQNKAASQLAGPNAMLLPFPSNVHMGPENILDTRDAKSILKDYAEAIKPKTKSFSRGITRSLGMLGDDDDIQVFESGNYHVVLASNASAIPSALRFVPTDKRPKVNQAIFDRYAEFYPAASWQLALCCWNGTVEAEPLMWWYEPNDPTSFFFPSLDAHDGHPPVLSGRVEVDHTLIVGSSLTSVPNAVKVYSREPVPAALKPFVAEHVAGAEYNHQRLQNGDWRFAKTSFTKVCFIGSNRDLFERVPPPSA